jgi:hypothetical protein
MRNLDNSYISEGDITMNDKIVPSDEIINQLKETAKNQNNRSYSCLMKQIDWELANAEQLDKAIGVALAYVDMKRAKQLTEIGLEHFPDNQIFIRVWRLFNPPPARVGKTKWRSSIEALDASMNWMEEHADEYERGHWLAVKNGDLVADAPTRHELDKIIESLGGPEILATDSIVQQVIA